MECLYNNYDLEKQNFNFPISKISSILLVFVVVVMAVAKFRTCGSSVH